MKRRLFNLASAISLLLCVMMTGLMVCGLLRAGFLQKYEWHPQINSFKQTQFTFTGYLYFQSRSNVARTAIGPAADQLIGRLRAAGEMQWRFWNLDTPPGEFHNVVSGFYYDDSSGLLANGLPWWNFEIGIPY